MSYVCISTAYREYLKAKLIFHKANKASEYYKIKKKLHATYVFLASQLIQMLNVTDVRYKIPDLEKTAKKEDFSCTLYFFDLEDYPKNYTQGKLWKLQKHLAEQDLALHFTTATKSQVSLRIEQASKSLI